MNKITLLVQVIGDDVALKRILLADDHVEIIEDVRSLLGDRYDIVSAVQDGLSLVSEAQALEPDLIISDISMPGMSGLEAVSRIRELGMATKVIFLTIQTSAAYVKKARSIGASGYVIKTQATEQLPTAVARVLAGESAFSEEDEF